MPENGPYDYRREDFKPAPRDGHFYCPGCNASPDDFVLPSTHCPCSTYGTRSGSLTTGGVEAYLNRGIYWRCPWCDRVNSSDTAECDLCGEASAERERANAR